MNFITKLFCKHKWIAYGWTVIKCEKCDKKRYDQKKNSELRDEYMEKIRKTLGDEEFKRYLKS